MSESNSEIKNLFKNGRKGDPVVLGPSALRVYRRATGYEDIQPENLLRLGKKYSGGNGDFLRELIILGGHSFIVDEQGNVIGPHSEEISLPSNSPDSEVK